MFPKKLSRESGAQNFRSFVVTSALRIETRSVETAALHAAFKHILSLRVAVSGAPGTPPPNYDIRQLHNLHPYYIITQLNFQVATGKHKSMLY